jgi:hypothetical protein
LAELANAAPKNEKYFSLDLLEGMVMAKQEDPSILIRGALIVQDPQGKNKFSAKRRPAGYGRHLEVNATALRVNTEKTV